jgi:hypothetical protein
VHIVSPIPFTYQFSLSDYRILYPDTIPAVTYLYPKTRALTIKPIIQATVNQEVAPATPDGHSGHVVFAEPQPRML